MEKKREGTITISNLTGEGCPNLKFSVDFSGFNEGSGSPCENEQEVKEKVEQLIKKHKNYNLKIVDERIKQMTL